MSSEPNYPCLVCSKDVLNDAIQCSLCLICLHRKCARITKNELKKLSRDEYNWFCIDCCNILPFQSIAETEFDFIFSDVESASLYELSNRCMDFELEYDNAVNTRKHSFDSDIDPDINFYNKFDTECSYYTDEKFKHSFKNVNGLSILHFNCRSIRSCFGNLKDYILSLEHVFSLICISESWLSDDNMDDYMLDNYDIAFMNRKKQKGWWS